MWLNDCKSPYESKKLVEYNINAKLLGMVKKLTQRWF